MKKEYNNMSLYELLNSNGNKLYKGASEQLINGFERIFNVELPIEYRELLKYTNGADLFDGDITLYSLFDESISVKHCNLLGNANSPIAKKDIPNELLVIGIYNFGDLICINLNNGNNQTFRLSGCCIYITETKLTDFSKLFFQLTYFYEKNDFGSNFPALCGLSMP